MKYISTRGQAPALNFEEVLLTGLASDGGLYVPQSLPVFSAQEIADMVGLTRTAIDDIYKRAMVKIRAAAEKELGFKVIGRVK